MLQGWCVPTTEVSVIWCQHLPVPREITSPITILALTPGTTHTHTLSVLVLCTYKCFEGDQSADKMSSSLTSGGHYRKEANTLDRYAGILFFSLRGLCIPGGWSVKLVDIFLVPINLWFDSLFLAVFSYCLLQTEEMQTPFPVFSLFISLRTADKGGKGKRHESTGGGQRAVFS